MLTPQVLTDRINTLLYLGFEKNEKGDYYEQNSQLEYSVGRIEGYPAEEWEIEMDFIEYILSK